MVGIAQTYCRGRDREDESYAEALKRARKDEHQHRRCGRSSGREHEKPDPGCTEGSTNADGIDDGAGDHDRDR